MKLRMKAALIIGVTFLVIFVAVGVILNILMMDQLEEHEDDMVTGYAERAQMSLSAAIDNLDTTLLEWANWDDPYYCMEEPQPGIRRRIPRLMTASTVRE